LWFTKAEGGVSMHAFLNPSSVSPASEAMISKDLSYGAQSQVWNYCHKPLLLSSPAFNISFTHSSLQPLGAFWSFSPALRLVYREDWYRTSELQRYFW
jgi:hypothetical protein